MEYIKTQNGMKAGKMYGLMIALVEDKQGQKSPMPETNNKETGGERCSSSSQRSEEKYKCKNCNRWHRKGQCPAHGKTCENCGELNHFRIVCDPEFNDRMLNAILGR